MLLRKPKTLLQVYLNPIIDGIFQSMAENTTLNEFFTKLNITNYKSLDMQYYLNRSGEKTASTLLEYMVSGKILGPDAGYVINSASDLVTDTSGMRVTYGHVMKNVNDDLINSLIVQEYLPIWERMYDTFVTEFDPTKPYNQSMEETSSDKLDSEGTSTNSGTTSSEYESSDTRENSATVDTTRNGTENVNRSVYAFNASSEPSPDSTNDTTTSATEKNESSDNYTGSNSGNSSGTNSNNGSTTYNSARDITRNVNRSGNIGNRSTAELLSEAIEYYKFNILEQIYSDLDGILTRSKYIS